jgi:hypothetical protein
MRARSIVKWAVPTIMLIALTAWVTPMPGDAYSRNNAMKCKKVQGRRDARWCRGLSGYSFWITMLKTAP